MTTDYVDWGSGELLAMTALDAYPVPDDGLPKSTSVVFRIHQLGHAYEALLARVRELEQELEEHKAQHNAVQCVSRIVHHYELDKLRIVHHYELDKLKAQVRELEAERETILKDLAAWSQTNENITQGYLVAAVRDVLQIMVSEQDNAQEAEAQVRALAQELTETRRGRVSDSETIGRLMCELEARDVARPAPPPENR